MDWEAVKLIGVAVSLISGALTVGEKLGKWGKSAYQYIKKSKKLVALRERSSVVPAVRSFKKSRVVSFVAQQLSRDKKVYSVELKPRGLKKILITWFEPTNLSEIPLDRSFDMMITTIPPISYCMQRVGRISRL